MVAQRSVRSRTVDNKFKHIIYYLRVLQISGIFRKNFLYRVQNIGATIRLADQIIL
jgi:hypothetical protein